MLYYTESGFFQWLGPHFKMGLWLGFRWTCNIFRNMFDLRTYTCVFSLYSMVLLSESVKGVADRVAGWNALTSGWWSHGDGLHYFLWPLREQEGKEGGDEWRWVVPAARTAGEAHSGLPACLIYSAGRALCTPHHLPFCPLAVLFHSVVDAEKVRGHRTDTGVVHIWLSVGVLYFDGKSTGDVP